jgi:hypothetical protein
MRPPRQKVPSVDRPILFSGPMINALLEGRKTQTRRAIKIDADCIEPHEELPGEFAPWKNGERLSTILCPYGYADCELWVRETHYVWTAGNVDGSGRRIAYRATDPDSPCTWTPSIHMPRWASRLTLRITDVRVERLQEISADDADAEGWPGPDEGNTIRNAYPIAWYSHLWDQINGRRQPWASNPWVWVLAFEVVK